MSMTGTLLADFEEEVCMMDKITFADGYGSFTVQYTEGARFTAAITPDNSMVAQVAQADTEIKRYRITTSGNITLQQGDYIKRLVNNEAYKVLNSNGDKLAPTDSRLNSLRSTTMERVKLP